MRLAGLACLILAALPATAASGAEALRLTRAKMAGAENLINAQLTAMYPEEPYFLIGTARGAYLDGVGAVFSVEINLATAPGLSPFRPVMTKEDIARQRDRKETRLPLLRNKMYDLVGSLGNYLEALPPNEEVVFSVTLMRYKWEDTSGMPSQIIMRVPRGKLIEAHRLSGKPDAAIRTQEY